MDVDTRYMQNLNRFPKCLNMILDNPIEEYSFPRACRKPLQSNLKNIPMIWIALRLYQIIC